MTVSYPENSCSNILCSVRLTLASLETLYRDHSSAPAPLSFLAAEMYISAFSDVRTSFHLLLKCSKMEYIVFLGLYLIEC